MFDSLFNPWYSVVAMKSLDRDSTISLSGLHAHVHPGFYLPPG
jgi:hypothetical protein